MAHKRVIRVISYEGIDSWVEAVLDRSPLNNRLRTIFRKQGTVKELHRIELKEGEVCEGLDKAIDGSIMRSMTSSH